MNRPTEWEIKNHEPKWILAVDPAVHTPSRKETYQFDRCFWGQGCLCELPASHFLLSVEN